MPRLTDSRVRSIALPATGQAEHADDLVQGLRLRVGAGGKKAWIVRTRAGGKPVNKTLGAYPVLSVAGARQAALTFLRDLATGSSPKKHRTFGQLVDHWIEHVAKPNNRSWAFQKRRLQIYALPTWGSRSIDTITRGEIRDLVEAIEGDVLPNRVLTLLRTLFRYAVSRDWIEASPAEAISKPKVERSRDRVLSMDEIARIYVGSTLLGYPFGGFIKMLLLTGQRRTEVAAMRWDELNLEEGTWTIPAANSKSNRAHLVPLSSAALVALRTAPHLGDNVWTNDGKSHVSGFSKAKSRLDSFLAAPGPGVEAWVLHDLRRTVATHMVRLGVSETIVGRVLNHSAQGVTAKVYALHSYAPEKRNAMDLWAAEVERHISAIGPAGTLR